MKLKQKIYISGNIPDIAKTMLEEYFDVEINTENLKLNKEQLINKIKDCDGVICQLSDAIDKEVMERCPKVKIFANYAVGFNNIDIKEAQARNIMVTNTPGVLTHATADLAWALLFAAARRIIPAHKYTEGGSFKGWEPRLFLGYDITGKTLGIIGAGRIGRAFAKKATAFDMSIKYYSRSRNEAFETETGAKYCALDELLKDSDYISIHTPLTAETKHLIGKDQFVKMRSNAILINTARGPVVDENALVWALKEGIIAGAGLDVYEEEPLINKELIGLENVVLLPHIGSATYDTRNEMARMAAQDVIKVLQGHKPCNPVY